jgi:hypothetical protein
MKSMKIIVSNGINDVSFVRFLDIAEYFLLGNFTNSYAALLGMETEHSPLECFKTIEQL